MKAFPSERSQKEEVDVFRRGCRRLYGPSENACCAFPYLAENFDRDRNIFKCTPSSEPPKLTRFIFLLVFL